MSLLNSNFVKGAALLFGGPRAYAQLSALSQDEEQRRRQAQQEQAQSSALDSYYNTRGEQTEAAPGANLLGGKSLLPINRRKLLAPETFAGRQMRDADPASAFAGALEAMAPDPGFSGILDPEQIAYVNGRVAARGLPQQPEAFDPVRLQKPGTDQFVMARSPQQYNNYVNNGFVESSGAVPGAQQGPTPFELEKQNAERSKWEREDRADNAAFNTFDFGMEEMSNKAAELYAHPGLPRITGLVGANTPDLSDDARMAAALLETLQSETSLAAIQAARQGSSSGATGFGALNKEELNLLNRKVAALKRALETGDFRGELKDVMQYATKMRNMVRRERGLPEVNMPELPALGGMRDITEGGFGNIPENAVNYLRQNPNLRDQFDQKYGVGAADSVLGM